MTSRRDFLIFSRQVLFSASALSICPLSLRAVDMDALALKHLDAASGLLLAQVVRLLFPHDSLPDTVYLDVLRDIEADMRDNQSTSVLIKQATAVFNSKAGGVWQTTSLEQQREVLRMLQGSELFRYLQNRTIESLYRNPEVWKLIGYQGSSVQYGGYLHRGFDDIDWLD